MVINPSATTRPLFLPFTLSAILVLALPAIDAPSPRQLQLRLRPEEPLRRAKPHGSCSPQKSSINASHLFSMSTKILFCVADHSARARPVFTFFRVGESTPINYQVAMDSNPCSFPFSWWAHAAGRERGATILEMRHHAYCSKPERNRVERTKQLLASDEARVRYLQAQLPGFKTDDYSEAQIPLVSGIKLRTLNYIVSVELGGKKTTLIVDTGSELTWVQCKPCTYCYNQQGPLFDPSASSTYHPVPCNSSTCSILQLATGDSAACGARRPTCSYILSYGDGSYSSGELARDEINLAGTAVQGFVFGCGRSNRGLFGGASGLMGLGRGQISLVGQTADRFGGVFSYCLPSRDHDSSGSLVLGEDYSVYNNSTAIAFTGIVSSPQMLPYYLLNLTGISLGGVHLKAPGFSSGKFIVDSGTVITRLPPSVYAALTAEFARQFSAYPPTSGFSILGSCFNLSGYKEVSIPTLSLEFEGGAAVDVDVSGMLFLVRRDASQACLAVASLSYESQLGIIGNYQQKNMRVVYDTAASRVGFAPDTCSYD